MRINIGMTVIPFEIFSIVVVDYMVWFLYTYLFSELVGVTIAHFGQLCEHEYHGGSF